jgi:hypothetical protein
MPGDSTPFLHAVAIWLACVIKASKRPVLYSLSNYFRMMGNMENL